MVSREASRFPRKQLLHMPGSTTTRGRLGACDSVPKRIAFRNENIVGAPDIPYFAARWLAYASLCRRFTYALASGRARLEVDVVRYTFIVMELHHVLLAGLPAHSRKRSFSRQSGLRYMRLLRASQSSLDAPDLACGVFDFDHELRVSIVVESDRDRAFGRVDVPEDATLTLVKRAGRNDTWKMRAGRTDTLPPLPYFIFRQGDAGDEMLSSLLNAHSLSSPSTRTVSVSASISMRVVAFCIPHGHYGRFRGITVVGKRSISRNTLQVS